MKDSIKVACLVLLCCLVAQQVFSINISPQQQFIPGLLPQQPQQQAIPKRFHVYLQQSNGWYLTISNGILGSTTSESSATKFHVKQKDGNITYYDKAARKRYLVTVNIGALMVTDITGIKPLPAGSWVVVPGDPLTVSQDSVVLTLINDDGKKDEAPTATDN